MILSIVNQKGGVGKTTTSLNTAASLAQSGQRTLLVDLDPQANSSSCLNVRASESVFDALVDDVTLESVIVSTPIDNLDLAPGHRALAGLDGAMGYAPNKIYRLADRLKPLLDKYDVIVIDTAPAPLFSPAGIAGGMALVACDIALIALEVEELAIEGLGQVLRSIKEAQDERLNPRLQMRIVLTMADARRSKAIEESARARFGESVYQTVIPRLAEIAKGLSNRERGGAVVAYAPKSAGALAYNALAQEIADGFGLKLNVVESEVVCG